MLTKRKQTQPAFSEPSMFRDLYTSVLGAAGRRGCSVLGVTSAMDGEGKTLIATNLAIVLSTDKAKADSGEEIGDILIFDCNQDSQAATEEFMVEPVPGLVHYLRRECELEAIIKPTMLPHLWVMPAGSSSHDFSALIRVNALEETMQRLRERFGLIIIDLPSLLTTTDTQVLATLADRVLVVVYSGVTKPKLLSQAVRKLNQQKLAGFVLNDHRPDLPSWLAERM